MSRWRRLGYNRWSPRSPNIIPFSFNAKQPACGEWVGAVQTDLCSLKKTPACLPIRKESSQKVLGRKQLSGGGIEKRRSRRARSLFWLFSGFECAPKLRKPWPSCSLTLLFSISRFSVVFHIMAMEDLQPLHWFSEKLHTVPKVLKTFTSGWKSKSVCGCMRVHYNCPERMR